MTPIRIHPKEFLLLCPSLRTSKRTKCSPRSARLAHQNSLSQALTWENSKHTKIRPVRPTSRSISPSAGKETLDILPLVKTNKSISQAESNQMRKERPRSTRNLHWTSPESRSARGNPRPNWKSMRESAGKIWSKTCDWNKRLPEAKNQNSSPSSTPRCCDSREGQTNTSSNLPPCSKSKICRRLEKFWELLSAKVRHRPLASRFS